MARWCCSSRTNRPCAGFCAPRSARTIFAWSRQARCARAWPRPPGAIPDVILLDLGLPDGDGLDATRQLREWTSTPIIVLSARGQEQDKIAALDAGADDYLTKPFSVGELLARIRVALRHRAAGGEPPAAFEAGALKVDLARRTVTVAGEEVHLTPTEYKLLAVLVKTRRQGPDPSAVAARGLGVAQRDPDPGPSRLCYAASAQDRAGPGPPAPADHGAWCGVQAEGRLSPCSAGHQSLSFVSPDSQVSTGQ